MSQVLNDLAIPQLYLNYFALKSLKEWPKLNKGWPASISNTHAYHLFNLLKDELPLRIKASNAELALPLKGKAKEGDVEQALACLLFELNIGELVSCCYLENGVLFYKTTTSNLLSISLNLEEKQEKFKSKLVLAHAFRWGWRIEEQMGLYSRVYTESETYCIDYNGCSCKKKSCSHTIFNRLVLADRQKYQLVLKQYEYD